MVNLALQRVLTEALLLAAKIVNLTCQVVQVKVVVMTQWKKVKTVMVPTSMAKIVQISAMQAELLVVRPIVVSMKQAAKIPFVAI
jgi:hypothetical protein